MRKKIDYEKLKNLLDAVKDRYNIPSYSITIYEKGSKRSISSGYYNQKEKLDADENTLYAIGSCTKSFTTGAICTLVDKGLMSLDARVKDYIPEFEMYDSYATYNLTIRDVLSHRSGLPRHDLSWYFRLEELTQNEVIQMFKFLKPTKPLRYKWQYNNYMFALAGYIIQRVTGKPWQEVVQENILAPLGIANYAFTPCKVKEDANLAKPYLYNKKNDITNCIDYAEIGTMGSAGSIVMSSSVLAKWVNLLLNDGTYLDKQIISKEMVKEMTSPQMIIDSAAIQPLEEYTTNKAYGLGLMMEYYNGHRAIYHGGNIDGFAAYQCYLPDEDIAWSVLTNLGENKYAKIMSYIIMEHFFDGGKDWLSEFSEFYKKSGSEVRKAKQKPNNLVCPIKFKNMQGKYKNDGYGDIELIESDGELSVKIGKHVLKAKHHWWKFFLIEVDDLASGVSFEACVEGGARGEVLSFDIALNPESEEKITFKPI